LIVVGAVTSNVQIGQTGVFCILVGIFYGVGIVGGGLALIVVGAVTSNVQIFQIGGICILVAIAYGVGIQVGQEKNDD